jgi:hypothetical protein
MAAGTGIGDCCKCGLGRCFGTPMSVHWTFWFNWIFQVVFAVIQYSNSWKYILVIAILWGPVSIVMLIFHELGHIWSNRSFGGTCHYSMLWPLGGFNDCNIPGGTCLQEFWVALCGPLMHIPQFFIWIAVMAVAAPNGVDYYGAGFDIEELDNGGADIWFADLSKRALDVNIMLFALNLLLPAYPMDCARMVAALSVHCGLSVERAGLMLVIVGAVLGFGCFIYGILSLVSGEGPGLFLLLIGLFVLYTSWTLYAMVKAKTIHQHPIFQPDCYKGRSTGRTNLSDPVSEKQGSPPSPRASSNKPLPKRGDQPSPRASRNKPLPKRGSQQNRPNNQRDVEMGNTQPSTNKPAAKHPPNKQPSSSGAEKNAPKQSGAPKKKTAPKK